MDGLPTDDEDDDGEGSDKEMGVDAEDGDEADSIRLQKLAAQVTLVEIEGQISYLVNIHLIIQIPEFLILIYLTLLWSFRTVTV